MSFLELSPSVSWLKTPILPQLTETLREDDKQLVEVREVNYSLSLPGAMDVFYAPYHFFSALKDLIIFSITGDDDGIAESTLKLTSAFFSFIRALDRISLIFVNVATTVFNKTVWSITLIFGLIVCAIELGFEGFRLGNQASFHSSMISFKNSWMYEDFKDIKLEDLSDKIEEIERAISNSQNELTNAFGEESYLNMASFLQMLKCRASCPGNKIEIMHDLNKFQRKFAQESQNYDLQSIFKEYCYKEKKVENSIRQLYNRLQPWQAKEFIDKTPEIVEGLNSKDPTRINSSIEAGKELLESMKIQSEKKLLIHCLGIIAIAATIASMIGAFILPPVPIMILGIVSAIVCAAPGILGGGMLDVKGWDFDPVNLIPNWLRVWKWCDSPSQKNELITTIKA